jgi:hypothetical protein
MLKNEQSMKDSESYAKAEGATYAGVNLIPPQYMQLTLKPMKDSGTASATTLTTDVTHSGKESEQSTISCGANT